MYVAYKSSTCKRWYSSRRDSSDLDSVQGALASGHVSSATCSRPLTVGCVCVCPAGFIHRLLCCASQNPIVCAATVLSLGADDDGGWLDDVERFNKPLVAKVPKCMSCRTYVPYRLVKAQHIRALQAHGFLEWCSKCIKNTPNGKVLFEPGGLFGPPASSLPRPSVLPLKQVGEGASAKPGIKPDANSALPATLQKMLLEEEREQENQAMLALMKRCVCVCVCSTHCSCCVCVCVPHEQQQARCQPNT